MEKDKLSESQPQTHNKNSSERDRHRAELREACQEIYAQIEEIVGFSPEKYREANRRMTEWKVNMGYYVAAAADKDNSPDEVRYKLLFLAYFQSEDLGLPWKPYKLKLRYFNGEISTDEFLQEVDALCSVTVEDIRQWIKENSESLREKGYGSLEWF